MPTCRECLRPESDGHMFGCSALTPKSTALVACLAPMWWNKDGRVGGRCGMPMPCGRAGHRADRANQSEPEAQDARAVLEKRAVKPDMVNEPPHYKGGRFRSGNGDVHEIQAIHVVEAFGLNRNHYRASAIAYLLRADKKGKAEDLRKAIWFIEREIARMESGE